MPEIEGAESFTGTIAHSSDHGGGESMAGKKVIVVGAGSSGHDVAQDAYENGAQVTMVQRGADPCTCRSATVSRCSTARTTPRPARRSRWPTCSRRRCPAR